MTPPRLAERLLAWRLAAEERDDVIGDLNEQFGHRAATAGDRAARRWYWRQVAALLWGLSPARNEVISGENGQHRRSATIDNVTVDVRYAWRALRHSPSFVTVAVLTLTFGIGVSTAVFSLVQGILLAPLPYARADALVRLSEAQPGSLLTGGVSDTGLGGWVSTPTAISKFAAYITNNITIQLPDGAANLSVSSVSGQFFDVLSMTPVAGRRLTAADIDPASPTVVMIGERLARRSFGGAQAALGKTVGLETQTAVVVGVVPADFAFPSPDVDVWQPGRQYWHLPKPGDRRNMNMQTDVIGLLADGATLADAAASAARIAGTLALADDDATNGTAHPRTFAVTRLLDDIVAPIKPALLMLTTGTIAVLLAVCINLVSLFLARNTARQRELALRLALGAGRWRVASPVLIELLMLSGAGAAGGCVIAWWLLHGLPAVAPAHLPRIDSIHFDLRALGFAASASVVTAILVGWLPLLRTPRTDIRELTASGARVRVGRFSGSADSLRGVLVAGQVGLAVVLLVSALLVGHSLSALLHVNLGYQPEGVLTFQAAQPFSAMKETGRLHNYYSELLSRLKQLPSVVSVGTAAVLPMHPIGLSSSVHVVGRPPEPVNSVADLAVTQPVTPDYLRTIGTRVFQGRGFSDADSAFSEKVMLIDDVLARRLFPNGDAIGHSVKQSRFEWRIVGVVEAMRIGALGQEPSPVMYFPAEQMPEFTAFGHAGVAVRTAGDPNALAPVVREVAHAVDPRVPLYAVRPLRDDISGSVAQPRFFTVAIGLFALLALSTALLGIYGVLAYAVERRRMEFGIRRALGATERDVTTIVLRRGAALAGAGLVVGLGGAAITARSMRALLYGITPADPWSYAGATVMVVAVVLVASWQPVRRALRINPAQALRVD